MINLKEVYQIQSKTQMASYDGEGNVTFEQYSDACRIFTSENLPQDYFDTSWTTEKRSNEMEKLIATFVEKHKIAVQGYVINGILNIDSLMSDIRDVVMGAGILKEALEDPTIDEIQVNDAKTVYVIRGGVPEAYVNKMGRSMQFLDDKELRIVLNRLIDDGRGNLPQFTAGLPMLNAKTAKEQYRINATDSSINTSDMTPFNFPVTTIVLRKFKEVKLTVKNLVNGHSITPKMGRFLTLAGRTRANIFFVGPTGSGKTTLLDVVMKAGSKDDRIIAIQNPTEVSFFERDSTGRNRWNVIHWEARGAADPAHPKPSDPTMENLLSNSLRCTPDIILCGEARDGVEFAQLSRMLKTGECIRGTYHAVGVKGGVDRFASDAGSVTGTSVKDTTRDLSDKLDLIIYQDKFGARRRVCEIGEVLGVDENDRVIVNMLFRFDIDAGVVDKTSEKSNLLGRFVMENGISPKLQRKFYKALISKEEIEEFLTAGDAEDFGELEEYAERIAKSTKRVEKEV